MRNLTKKPTHTSLGFPFIAGPVAREFCKVSHPTLDHDSMEGVYVTSVTDPRDFFCQLTKMSNQLENLMNDIEEHYRPLGGNEGSYTQPRVGEACCAMFSEDDGWYRARVTEITGDTIGVCYIDYGNSETLSLARVKVLTSKFAIPGARGFYASLDVTSDVDVPNFEASVLEQELSAKIVKNKGAGFYEVELSGLDGVRLFEAGSKESQGI